MITAEQKQTYEQNGYVVIAGLFSAEETATYRAHFMHLRETGSYPGDFDGAQATSTDPLKRYPRMIHMHRWDQLSLEWLLDARINAVLTALAGREPLAVQTMLYFKPPRARGQALHQDNYFLRVQPSTFIAARLALDPCDEANGCMRVVPGSQKWPLLCTVQADLEQSFTDITVPIPPDQQVDNVIMGAGDVLFFNGSLVHGSNANTSTDRFRRALIGHYIEGDAREVGSFYHPVLRMDGTEIPLAESEAGSQCGIWVERDGQPVIELSGVQRGATRSE